MKDTARKQALIATVLAITVLMVLLMLVGSFSRRRILMPPQISTQVLQPDTVDLMVKKSETGAYNYVCRYELQPDGSVKLAESDCWQSYDRSIPDSLYRKLRRIKDAGRLLQVQQTSTGWLNIYGREGSDLWTIVETDAEGTECFRYVFDGSEYVSPAVTAITDGESIYILSYQRNTDHLCITSVNKTTGEEKTVGVSYVELSGDPLSENHMGGFLYDGSNVRVSDGVLYLAATCFSETDGAVIAAWDMNTQRTKYFQIVEGAQIMSSRWKDNGVQVLLNHKSYSPLELRTIDFTGQQPDTSVEMPLPPEFGGRTQIPAQYFLFESQLSSHYTAVLYPNLQHRLEQPDELRRTVLAVYDNSDGSLISTTALELNSCFDIYEIRLHEAPLALKPFVSNE